MLQERNILRVQVNPDQPEGDPIEHVEWTNDEIVQLRKLWHEGISTAEIGERLGRSGRSVVGKVGRLKLAPRQSPIKPVPDHLASKKTLYERVRKERMRQAKANGTHRSGGVQLPSEVGMDPDATRAHDARMARPTITPKPPRPAPAPKPIYVAPAPVYGRVVECSWVVGDAKAYPVRYCDAPSRPGKSFCPDHCAIVYAAGPMQSRTIDKLAQT